MLIALDPGKRSGLAFFRGRQLVRALTCKDAEVYGTIVLTLASLHHTGAMSLVSEVPEVYTHGAAKPRSLMPLLLQVGRVEGFLVGHYQVHPDNMQRHLPKQWKGGLDKHTHHERIAGHLDTAELGVLSGQHHDAWDAVGLGLYRLRRTGVGAKRLY